MTIKISKMIKELVAKMPKLSQEYDKDGKKVMIVSDTTNCFGRGTANNLQYTEVTDTRMKRR